MSMNLNAKTNDDKISLWQTPTTISYIILPPTMYSEVSGQQAKEALIRYIEWVKGTANGPWDSIAELQNYTKLIKEHIKYITSFLNDPSLVVYVM